MDFAKEFAVSQTDSPGPMHLNQILIVIVDLHDCAGFVPFGGMMTGLVLHSANVTD